MGDNHPYVQGSGHLVQLITHLRSTFPAAVSADTLRQLGLAPKNESYVVNTLRFLGFIDEEGKRTELAGKVFSLHEDDKFQEGFAKAVKASYVDLFALHSEGAWKLDTNGLITFFRQADQSSAIVGSRQAKTFLALSGLAGRTELAPPRSSAANGTAQKRVAKKAKKKSSAKSTDNPTVSAVADKPGRDMGLTVRIEVNLPASGDQATYDRIFKSIRENLLDG